MCQGRLAMELVGVSGTLAVVWASEDEYFLTV